MKVTKETRLITYPIIKIGRKTFSVSLVREILDALEDTDSYFKRIIIHDQELEDSLAKKKVIWQSVRGSVAKGQKYEEFVKEFEEATKDL